MALARTNAQVVSHGWTADFGEINSLQSVYFQGPAPANHFTVPLSSLPDLQTSITNLTASGRYSTTVEVIPGIAPVGTSGPVEDTVRYVTRVGRDMLTSLTEVQWSSLVAALSDAVARDDLLPNNAWDSTISSRDGLRGFYPGLKQPGEVYSLPGLV